MGALFMLVLQSGYMVLGWLVRSVVGKMFLYFGLFFITSEFVPILFTGASSLLPGTSGISSGLSALPAGIWYFLDLFKIDVGLPIVLSAYATRFVIRRIPIIG
jgi:Protein of unknown function (DUF2523)